MSCREWTGQLGGNGARVAVGWGSAWVDVRPAKRFDVVVEESGMGMGEERRGGEIEETI